MTTLTFTTGEWELIAFALRTAAKQYDHLATLAKDMHGGLDVDFARQSANVITLAERIEEHAEDDLPGNTSDTNPLFDHL